MLCKYLYFTSAQATIQTSPHANLLDLFFITAFPLHRLWSGPMAQQVPHLQDLRLREVSHSKDM